MLAMLMNLGFAGGGIVAEVLTGRRRRTKFYTGPLHLPAEIEAPLKPTKPEELYKRLAQLDAYIQKMQEIDDEESFYLLH